jgi:ATP-dependent Clp protease ATP-binding subunit ClpA
MLQTNPEIDHIIVEASELAKQLSHEYVTLEHVFLSMVRYVPFREFLVEYGADIDGLDAELSAYLEEQLHLVTKDIDPKKTHALERVFNQSIYTSVV